MEYTVRVRATNGEGYGPFSSTVSVTTYQDGEFFHPLHQQINCFLLRVCTRQQYVSNNNSMPSVATFSADFHVTNFPLQFLLLRLKTFYYRLSNLISYCSCGTDHQISISMDSCCSTHCATTESAQSLFSTQLTPV